MCRDIGCVYIRKIHRRQMTELFHRVTNAEERKNYNLEQIYFLINVFLTLKYIWHDDI